MNVRFGSLAVIQIALKLSEKIATLDLSNCGIALLEINFFSLRAAITTG